MFCGWQVFNKTIFSQICFLICTCEEFFTKRCCKFINLGHWTYSYWLPIGALSQLIIITIMIEILPVLYISASCSNKIFALGILFISLKILSTWYLLLLILDWVKIWTRKHKVKKQIIKNFIFFDSQLVNCVLTSVRTRFISLRKIGQLSDLKFSFIFSHKIMVLSK